VDAVIFLFCACSGAECTACTILNKLINKYAYDCAKCISEAIDNAPSISALG